MMRASHQLLSLGEVEHHRPYSCHSSVVSPSPPSSHLPPLCGQSHGSALRPSHRLTLNVLLYFLFTCHMHRGISAHPLRMTPPALAWKLAPAWSVAACQGRRPRNEDTFCHGFLGCKDPARAGLSETTNGVTLLGAVFDGHGGAAAAKHCAAELGNLLHEHIMTAVDSGCCYNTELASNALGACFRRLDQQLAGTALLQGTTAVAALVNEHDIHVASCGKILHGLFDVAPAHNCCSTCFFSIHPPPGI
jgi:hypothetical protein